MANPHKGDVALKAGDKIYTLRFSVDALVCLESKAGELDGVKRKGVNKIFVELSDPEMLSISLVRVILWSALREHHPDIDVRGAGELMLQAGGMLPVLEKLTEALNLAFSPKSAEESGDAHP